MNAPQTFPVNGHRLRPVAQFLLGPLLERRLESLPVQPFDWTLRILSGISEGICNTMVQSGGEFLYIGVGGR